MRKRKLDSFRGVNGTLLSVYPIYTVFDKTDIDKIFFSVNLSGKGTGTDFFPLSKQVRVRTGKAYFVPITRSGNYIKKYIYIIYLNEH